MCFVGTLCVCVIFKGTRLGVAREKRPDEVELPGNDPILSHGPAAGLRERREFFGGLVGLPRRDLAPKPQVHGCCWDLHICP